MSTIVDNPAACLAARLREERLARGWSLRDLAARSGVSRAMIHKVETGQANPTAVLLGRLSGAFGLTLSALLAPAADGGRRERLTRAAAQVVWRDPETGFVRRQIAPAAGSDLPVDIVAVDLPAGAAVRFPAAAYEFLRQVIWVTEGRLSFVEGETVHRLEPGDSLELGPPSDCVFRNETDAVCRYVVVVSRQR